MKLFSTEEFEQSDIAIVEDKPRTIEDKLNNDIIGIDETITEYRADLNMASEGFLKASNELFIVRDIKASLESKKLSSVEYFVSIENYSLFLESITNNLGLKTKLPSMEDFKNPYGVKASHEITMEGFMEVIKSIWEKIKDFFKTFFKKIMLFLKRLVNADLQLDEYEEYIDGLISKIKRGDKTLVESIEIDSKLPSLLADEGMSSITPEYLFTKGEQKLDNLVYANNIIFNKNLTIYTTELRKINSELKSILKKDKIKEISLSGLQEELSNIRNNYIEELNKSIFHNSMKLNTLPDNVYDSALGVFERDQIEEDSIEVFSMHNERDMHNVLPKNFNIYYIISNFTTDFDIRTSKVFISSNKEDNISIKNRLNTINNSNNLIKFYDFYKKFNKDFNLNKVGSAIDNINDELNEMLKEFSDKFSRAISLENDSTFTNDLDAQTREIMRKREAKKAEEIANASSNDMSQSEIPNSNTDIQASDNIDLDDIENEELKDKVQEIQEMQRFIFNYLNSVQILIREASTGLVGLYQSSKYELIKYLYNSAKQF